MDSKKIGKELNDWLEQSALSIQPFDMSDSEAIQINLNNIEEPASQEDWHEERFRHLSAWIALKATNQEQIKPEIIRQYQLFAELKAEREESCLRSSSALKSWRNRK